MEEVLGEEAFRTGFLVAFFRGWFLRCRVFINTGLDLLLRVAVVVVAVVEFIGLVEVLVLESGSPVLLMRGVVSV